MNDKVHEREREREGDGF